MTRPTLAPILLATGIALLAGCLVRRAAAECSGCSGGCGECVPASVGTWENKTSAKPAYSMSCEYAAARGRDSWHAPDPECRCHPPCGRVIVKKRCFKTDGPEKIERAPKYEVRMVPVEPVSRCPHERCADADRLGWWNPVAWLHRCASWW